MENNEIIIELFDDNKQPHKYELLDIVNYKGSEYVVLLPEDVLFNNEVEIFKTKHSSDKSATLYEPVKDNYINHMIYEIFKNKFENVYPGRIKFE